MLDVRTSDKFRIIQVFISAEGRGIFESYVSTEDSSIVCTCPGFYYRSRCKHTEFIEDTVRSTPGNTYNVQVVTENGADLMPEPSESATNFRLWLLDNCRIVVL